MKIPNALDQFFVIHGRDDWQIDSTTTIMIVS